VDELKAPIAGIQADDAWANGVEVDGQFQQGAGKGSSMTVGWGDQEMHGQTRAATKQGMHPIAMQEGTGMVGGSMTSGGIGISSAPGQDGSTNQMAAHGTPDGEYEKGLEGRRSCRRPSFTQLRRARNARLASGVEWQATGQGQSSPTDEPVMHVPGRESRKTRFEQGDQHQRLFTLATRATACRFGEWWWTAPMRHLNGQAAQRQQVQGFDQAKGIDM
jgi:hypothetical protein